MATGSVPVTPVVSGRPVTLVITPEAGVPSAGAVKVGEVSVTPAKLVTVEPSDTAVDPIVTDELVRNALGNVDATDETVTFVSVRLATEVTVLPSVRVVKPSVMGVAKLLSSCDNGREDVAVANVYGTAIRTSLSIHVQTQNRGKSNPAPSP